jgi:diguanylate cyclase (GGDEF)-like protein
MTEMNHTPATNPETNEASGTQDDYILNDPMAVLHAVSQEVLALREKNNQLDQELELDPKTGLLNAVAFETRMREEKQSGTLLLLDLDFFKKVNQRFKYVAADDRFLKPAAQSLRDNIRSGSNGKGDLAARFGGEEFIVFLRGATPAESTVILKRIYEAINALEFGNDAHGKPIKIAGRTHLGASVGIVEYPAGADYKERLTAANTLLETAKHDGRNTYVLEGGDELPGASYPLPTLE